MKLDEVADRITESVGYLEVSIAGRDAPLPWSCADVVAAQERGDDPTGGWRQRVSESQRSAYGVPAPARVAAAFVVQWYLGLVAVPVAGSAILSEWVLPAEPEAIRFDLSDEEGYPVAVALAAAPATRIAAAAERMDEAHRRYLAHARRFVAGYRPPVKMSSRQRDGMVTDAWSMAVLALAPPRDGQGRPPAGGAVATERFRRVSCCFIFALPGAQACRTCPRRGRAAGSPAG